MKQTRNYMKLVSLKKTCYALLVVEQSLQMQCKQSLKAHKNITPLYLFIKKIKNVLQKTLIKKAVL